jgi:O-antigen ligase
MFLIPFVSFVVYNYLGQPTGPTGPTALQGSIIAAILLITLLIAAFKNKLEFPIEMLPYLAMPVVLFASIDRKLEFTSYDSLLCFSMFAATLLIFLQKEIYSKWIFRSMLICGNLHLLVQVFGAIKNNKLLAISTLFPMANEIMFFYMLLIFCSIFIFFKDNAFWKKYAAAIAILAFISIAVGETIHTKKFEIGDEHALGIWLGLGCGTLFTAAMFLWKKFNLPRNLGISFAALIFMAWMLAPIIAVNSGFFSSNTPGEATTRLDNWQAALKLIKEKPLGAGFGTYGANIMQRWPTIEESYFRHGSTVFSAAHNQYLQILTEIGWLGWLYYFSLFAVPWFISIFRYLKTGKLHFLFIAGMLASVLSVMEVSEAMSMFAFIQIIYWIFLIYCVKALLPLRTKPGNLQAKPRKLRTKPGNFAITDFARNMFFIILIPLLSFLFYDRGKQLYSMHLTDSYIMKELNIAYLNNALEIHPKNTNALWYLWQVQMRHGKNMDALKTLEKLEEISGYRTSVSNARAEIYNDMGDMKKACEAAKFPIAHFLDPWTLDLKERLKCN